MVAVACQGPALAYAAEHFLAHKEVVLAAVTENGSALSYATDDLRADKTFVLEAVARRSSTPPITCAPTSKSS
jgi:hypothetical protein